METIYVILMNREYGDHHTEVEVINRYFTSEDKAKKWLEDKYKEGIDMDYLYLRWGALYTNRIKNECGINFHIQKLTAA